MSTKTLFFLLCAAAPVVSKAQTVRAATEQCWSGGVAGKHGCNYSFSIEFGTQMQTVLPDTLWIGETSIPLLLKNGEGGNLKKVRTKGGIRFEISAGTHFDDHELYPHPPGEAEHTEAPKPPRKYKGAALLSYIQAGKQQYFVIPKIITHLPHISYP